MIVEFHKPPPVRHLLRKKKREWDGCRHAEFIINDRAGTVRCGRCNEEVTPFQALLTLCENWWFEANCQEMQIEFDAKRVAKVQGAAIEHLFKMGITPEKYATKWAAENEKHKAIELKKEEAIKVTPIFGGGGAA